MRRLVLALGIPLLVFAVPASAHFNLTMPPSITQSKEGGKGAPPCGPDSTSPANAPVTAATGGQPLTLHIDETVGHKGYYRFALALKAVSEFPADAVVRDSNQMVLPVQGPGNSATADYETTPIFPVIADHVFAHDNTNVQSYPSTAVPGTVTLPNLNCDKCILQVTEFMAEHPSNGVAGYFYHHCAYLKITADPSQPLFDPSASSTGAGGGGSAGASSGGASGGGAPGSGGVAGESSTSGGVGGSAAVSAGGASTALGGSAGTPSAVGGAQGVAGAPGSAGAPGGSVAGASGASVPQQPANDEGGCSVSAPARSSRVGFGLALVGLLALRRRRAAR